MLTDFIVINKNDKKPIYIQIYDTLKKAIENGSIKENEKLPSIRKICSDLNISKTTVENAYDRLCIEGYITNKPQKGFYVEKGIYIEKSHNSEVEIIKSETVNIKYDFSGKGIDQNCSNIKEWRKYVKDILNKDYLLNTYSENQGEEKLRKAIEKYSFSVRGVNANFKNIIIGSGSQTLIYILCGMLGINKTVAIEKNTYPQAEQVFKDFDYNICYTESDSKGISIEYLKKIKPDILLINPNSISSNGAVMPITRKLEIINWAKNNNCLIIEDDYNGELRYKTHQTACMQSYNNKGIVYIGSFSKILLPSVRISYMVLPEYLLKKYEKIRNNYNQTTSKTEQLALASYISDGKLEKHLRKARRYYKTKSEVMLNTSKNLFNKVKFNETSMYISIPVELKSPVTALYNNGVKVMSTSEDNNINLSFSHIDINSIENGLSYIKSLL